MTRMSEDDELAAGFHDLLSHDELAALTDIALLSLLDEASDGSARRRQLEREWARRGSVQVAEPPKAEQSHARKEPGSPSGRIGEPKRRWPQEPIGIVGLGVVIVAIGALVTHLLRTHIGLTP